MQKAILYIHGKGGNPTEAEQYRAYFPGFDVIGVDYDGYLPWDVKEQLKARYDKLCGKYGHISVIANSIGAYFTMLALHDRKVEKALFISPILDMERLIQDMMCWAGVTESQLREQGEIPTDFGETLSWEYLCFARENLVRWDIPTEILYAGKDNLTSRETVEQFVKAHSCTFTVMENGEHWFHTEEQLAFLYDWIKGKTL